MKIILILKYTSLCLATIFIIFVTWFTWIGGTAYGYASYLEAKWIKDHPKTKGDLEKYLNLYSLHQIDPKTSMWGWHYELQPGERMMQYRILWNKNCPLDVVYDESDKIIHIYTSYE
jgi:hypothetical protein